MNDSDPWPDGWDLPDSDDEAARILDLFIVASESGTAGLVFVAQISEGHP